MKVKFMGRSGRVVNEEELSHLYKENHINASDVEFDIWLYLGIECGVIKVITY